MVPIVLIAQIFLNTANTPFEEGSVKNDNADKEQQQSTFIKHAYVKVYMILCWKVK